MDPEIFRIVTGEYQVNTYIVSCPETTMGLIIDPGGDADKILEYIGYPIIGCVENIDLLEQLIDHKELLELDSIEFA